MAIPAGCEEGIHKIKKNLNEAAIKNQMGIPGKIIVM